MAETLISITGECVKDCQDWSVSGVLRAIRPAGTGGLLRKLGLDKLSSLIRIGIPAFLMPDCQHQRTEFMMRRDGVDYLRCLDCDQVFEAEDLEQIALYDDEEEPRQRAG